MPQQSKEQTRTNQGWPAHLEIEQHSDHDGLHWSNPQEVNEGEELNEALCVVAAGREAECAQRRYDKQRNAPIEVHDLAYRLDTANTHRLSVDDIADSTTTQLAWQRRVEARTGLEYPLVRRGRTFGYRKSS